ncbi:site-specific integrase [Comamonas guangdongensis]|uniref:Site-specific integrase n=1 Tax=Comamonas guangdongensis TaxID=510515 RepID=A0ABV3ZXH4_9BURK
MIEFTPFDRIALAKLIRQTAKASDYVVQPFTQTEQQAILDACRQDEWPMLQFWFNSGLRPGEMQALQWDNIDLDRKTARIVLNQVAGVIKAPKTEAGKRDVEAVEALKLQRAMSQARNPYQIRHTYASTLLTAGANPWHVTQQLGHEGGNGLSDLRQVHPRGLPEA